MGKTRLFLPGLNRKFHDQRIVAPHQAVERFLDFAEAVKIIQTLGPAAKLTQSLRAAKQHYVEDGDFRRLELINGGQHMLVFGYATRAAIKNIDEVTVPEGFERVCYNCFVIGNDRFPVISLIACIYERIKC